MTCPPTEPQDLTLVWAVLAFLMGVVAGGVVRR